MSSVLVSKIISSDNRCILNQLSSIYTFLNPVSYLETQKHKDMYNKFDGIFVDGSLLVAAIFCLYFTKVKRRSFDMTSVAKELFEYAEKTNKTIYIVASKQEEVGKAVKIFKDSYTNLQIIGYRNGFFFSEEEKEVEVKKIVDLNPDYLIVGMGAIRQEEFLLKVKESGYKGIGFTCGGFIHQTAKNKIDYYPKWVDRYNVRFLYRMYKEKNTRKRYLKAFFVFPYRFVKERLFG